MAVDEDWEKEIHEAFKKIAGEDNKIQIAELTKILNFKESFFAERYFHLIDEDGSGEIDWQEFQAAIKLLSQKSEEEKLQFLFKVYDVNGDGSLSMDEIKQVLASCMVESELKLQDEQLDELTKAVFESADVNKDQKIECEEFKNELMKYPGIISNLNLNPQGWLQIKKPVKKQKSPLCAKARYYLSYYYIKNNLTLVGFYIFYILINIALFIVNAYRYRNNNVAVIIARGCGMCLNFNGAFVLVFMLRNCLTWLRASRIGRILPLDYTIALHKVVGYVIAFFTVVHTVCHVVNASIVSPSVNLTTTEIIFTTKLGIGYVGGSAFITGWILDVVLLLIILFSLPIVRGKGHFELFYYSHYLYLAFLILLVLHGPIFWYFLLLPGFLLVMEKCIFVYKMCTRMNKTEIIQVHLLPSKVTHLVIRKHHNFHYKAGDYIFIRIKDLAIGEWHPFTISGHPGQKDEIWLHIRTLGNWTKSLYEFFEKGGHRKKKNSVEVIMETKSYGAISTGHQDSDLKETLQFFKDFPASVEEGRKSLDIQIVIDGPFGTPTRDVSNSEHAVLVAAGIGVTPFASILQSLMYKYKHHLKAKKQEEKVQELKLKKVDFIWINRHATAFEWFIKLLTRLEMEEAEHEEFDKFLDTWLYMTGAKKASDLQGLGLQMALELIHKKEERDLITGLKTRTRAGRPDWDKIFQSLKEEGKGRVHVFFCGPPTLEAILKQKCKENDFDFSKETF